MYDVYTHFSSEISVFVFCAVCCGVQGYKQHRGYIIAQAPMESTCRDFWKTVYDRRCGVIIMLSDLMEQEKVSTLLPKMNTFNFWWFDFQYVWCLVT